MDTFSVAAPFDPVPGGPGAVTSLTCCHRAILVALKGGYLLPASERFIQSRKNRYKTTVAGASCPASLSENMI